MPPAPPRPASAAGGSKRPHDEPNQTADESSDDEPSAAPLPAAERALPPCLRVSPSQRAHYARQAQHLSPEQWKAAVTTERETGYALAQHARLLRWYNAYGPGNPDDLAFVRARGLSQIDAVPGEENDVPWRPGQVWCEWQCRVCEESRAKWIAENGEAKWREWCCNW